jgi:integrase
MERVYVRGRIYWGWYYDSNGRRIFRSTKCRDKRAAEAAVREWERGAADPNYAASNQTTVESALKQLIVDRKARGRAEGTLDMYQVKSGHVLRLLGGATPLAFVTAKRVDDFVAVRLNEGASRSTVHKELTTIRATLKVAKRRGEWRGDVDTIMPDGFAIEYKPKKRFLTGPELQELVVQLTPDRSARVCWIVATAARWIESDRARRSDIDFTTGQVWMRGSKTAEALAPVPIVGAAWDLLEHALRYCAGRDGLMFEPWTNVRRDLHAACERATKARVSKTLERRARHALPAPTAAELGELTAAVTFPPLSPNDLRRTNSTWLRQHGTEPHLIASMLRHADSRMVERVYGRMPPESLGAALRDRVGDCNAIVTASGGKGRKMRNMRPQKPHETPGFPVPRDGIEPPTRGFSVPCSTN